jgi:2-methylcitrate dehydratase PrpD
MSSVSAGQTAPPTNPEGPTGVLASWVHDIALDDDPPAVNARAKHLILDGVSCALIGAQLPWSRVATELGDVLRSSAVQMRGAGTGA